MVSSPLFPHITIAKTNVLMEEVSKLYFLSMHVNNAVIKDVNLTF